MGGVLVVDDDPEDVVRARYDALRAKWKIECELHSSEIRMKAQRFRWLRGRPAEEQNEFLADIGSLVTSPELTAIACVIDRPGYDARYREKYGHERWLLCKTAFTVVVERAVKFARSHNAKLRVLVERSDKVVDDMLRGYYEDLRTNGHPFDASNASKYAPLSVEQFRETLYEFRVKWKSSPLTQIADLVLWPMCIGGYDKANIAYSMLKRTGTLIDCKLPKTDVPERGIKYSCWEIQAPKKPEPDLATGLGQPPEGDLVG